MLKDYEALKSKVVNIKTVEGSKITFIIIENAGYFVFTESLYLSEGLTEFNAIQIDTATLNRLICHFISPLEREPHELNA